MNDTLLDPFLTSNDDLEKKLTLIKAIRAGQLPLNEHSWRGLLKNLDETSCRTLQEQSLAEGIPISTRLGSDNFDLDQMKAALASIIYNVYELELEPILNPIHLVEGLNNVLPEFLEHSLKDDAEYLSSLSKTLGVSSAILKLIGEALIEPSLTRISSMCLKGFLEGWVDLACPVCGRIPSVVTKDESEPWRFKCLLCGTNYKMDVFTCYYCRSKEKIDKNFLLVGENQVFEIAYCSKCNRYYKIINKTKLSENIPSGLEGLYTAMLDQISRERGLKRLDEK